MHTNRPRPMGSSVESLHGPCFAVPVLCTWGAHAAPRTEPEVCRIVI